MKQSDEVKRNFSKFLRKRHTSYGEKKYPIRGSTPENYHKMKQSTVRPFCWKCSKIKLTEEHSCT